KGYLVAFHIIFEIIENSLPAISLHFNGIFGFRVKSGGYFGVASFFVKSHLHRAAIGHGVGHFLWRLYFVIGGFKVKTETAVFGLHSGRVFSAFSQIITGTGAAP